jgi:splicing factor U2AF 65 kDa subunit
LKRDERRDRDRGDRDRDRRRRSRSPGHRSRRDYEVDTYSSSRDYREREREERYSGRERHEERGWDRDRGDRRRERRGDDDRRRGGDREAFEERRRGGQARAERRRSATPPAPKKKEPTPDLTDILSVLERKRRLTQWDIKPPGYENVTAEQAKLSGMFPLPGAPRQQVMDPSRLQAFMNQPGAAASAAALKPAQARQSKRLFVYNVPPTATDENIVEFFNLQLNGLNVIVGTDPCLSSMISKKRDFAMVEFRLPEDATVALALDGIEMEADGMDTSNGASNGSSKGLQIQRPQDYIAPTAVEDEEPVEAGRLSSDVKDSPNKICVSHIPIYLAEEQVVELLSTLGQLKSFVLVKDSGTEQSRVSLGMIY